MASTVKRQSAAVMFTDIAGYTSIMASDEEKALSLLQDKRKILKPLIKKHDGVYVKGTGDGTLSYFDSAYKASKCAKLFQESIYDNDSMNVHVGIHVGDIVLDDGDVYGDGVNVASRLESMSPVGGICVSNTVYDELRNKKDFDGFELGLQSLKGVGRLIEIYGLKGDLLTEPKPSDYQDNKVTVHSDDEVPSISIIPFRNKGKEEDAFYAYGICADLISDCSGAGLIRVESLERIEKIENYDKLDITELASKLLVRYVATGALWKMDEMFQLSIELYDTKDNKVVWFDRWEEEWHTLPAIKGNLSDGLLKALDTKPKIAKKTDKTNTEAYEYYLKTKYKYFKRNNTEDLEIARALMQNAVDLDDNLIIAKNLLGWTYSEAGDYDSAMAIYIPALKQAEEIGDERGVGKSYNNNGSVHHKKGDHDKALSFHTRSFKISEKIGDMRGIVISYTVIGYVYWCKGYYKKAEESLKKSLSIQLKIEYSGILPLYTTTYLYLTYKHLGIKYDKKEIHNLIQKSEFIEFDLNYPLYQILDDTSYLETAYNQVQELADNLDDKAKFLSYPIPKAILEEWEKVK